RKISGSLGQRRDCIPSTTTRAGPRAVFLFCPCPVRSCVRSCSRLRWYPAVHVLRPPVEGWPMTREEMTAQVAAELEHIPEGPGEQQKELRFRYNAVRRASLGKKVAVTQSANQVLQDCIARMRQSDPTVQVHYDKAFFEGEAS